MPKKKPKKGKPEVHKNLRGFDIKINEFGEIISNFEIDRLNVFLNENVDDKKLRDRENSLPESGEKEPKGDEEEE